MCKIYNVRCKIEIRTVVAVPFQSWAVGSGVIRGKLRPCCSFPSNYYQILRNILKDILRIFWEYVGSRVIRGKLRPCCSFPSATELIASKYWELFWRIFWEYLTNFSSISQDHWQRRMAKTMAGLLFYANHLTSTFGLSFVFCMTLTSQGASSPTNMKTTSTI